MAYAFKCRYINQHMSTLPDIITVTINTTAAIMRITGIHKTSGCIPHAKRKKPQTILIIIFVSVKHVSIQIIDGKTFHQTFLHLVKEQNT